MKYWLMAFMLVFVLCASWLGYESYEFLHTPPASPGQEIYFDVPPKASFSQIANELKAKGLISDARKFRWLARLKSLDNRLQAGRFALNSGWGPSRVLDTLVNGQPVLHRITIPEGLTWWQTGRLLADAGLVRYDDFKKIISDPDFLRHYGIPFSTAEGFLMPDTYLLKKTAHGQDDDEAQRSQAREVAGRMVDNFWRKAGNIWTEKPDKTELRRLAILASIVEKETGIDGERPRVAGVYANRLARNMPLQADPTVIYGLGPEFSGSLRRAQLDDAANAYNTYQHAGLPPGPICSFGAAALKAAINPEKHEFIYFVAKTDGGEHVFSRTLGEHNRAVEDYRRQKRNDARR